MPAGAPRRPDGSEWAHGRPCLSRFVIGSSWKVWVEAKLGVLAVCCCAGALSLLMLMLRIVSTRSDPDTPTPTAWWGSGHFVENTPPKKVPEKPKTQATHSPPDFALIALFSFLFVCAPFSLVDTQSRRRSDLKEGSKAGQSSMQEHTYAHT